MQTDMRMRFSIWLALSAFIVLSSCKESTPAKEQHKYTNALVHETSPYLLQHAHNPVDWRPWSEEALQEAKDQNKLVLVSIGYSSCHWCHVMEKETFEDEAVAEIMNENFVNIKVDREERPDVDQVYMTALQLIKGNGGWPLNVITLPDGKPLYGGTYHTNEQWKQVISEISRLYREDPAQAQDYANKVAAGVQEVNLIRTSDQAQELDLRLLEESLANWKPNWDQEWGGNKGIQKFMLPSNLNFLMQYAALSKDGSSLKYLENTLDKIAMGGIYDHIGGGFFRYSTDPYWKVPHFEKMLYDNAQLLGLYSKAYKNLSKPLYRDIVYGVFDYLQSEMKNPGGGYYAALDADSDGEEGKFYVWEEAELKEILGSEFDLFSSYYNIKPDTAWEGKYVLHKLESDFEFAGANSLNLNDFKEQIQSWRSELLKAREDMVRPGLDDKIITSWNALMIEGLVEAYKAFKDPVFLEAAQSTYSFIMDKSYDGKYLIHSYKENSRRIDGFLDDYAFLTSAGLELYEVTGDIKYLEDAQGFNRTVKEEFQDDSSVLFRYNRSDELISKIVKINDGVMPSPNAVIFRNQLKLGHILYDTEALDDVEDAISAVVPAIVSDPSNYTEWSSLLLYRTFPYFEIAVVGNEAISKAKQLQSSYIPNAIIVASQEKSELPLFKDRFFEDDTYIFVCRNNTCKLPTTSVQDALDQIENF